MELFDPFMVSLHHIGKMYLHQSVGDGSRNEYTELAINLKSRMTLARLVFELPRTIIGLKNSSLCKRPAKMMGRVILHEPKPISKGLKQANSVFHKHLALLTVNDTAISDLRKKFGIFFIICNDLIELINRTGKHFTLTGFCHIFPPASFRLAYDGINRKGKSLKCR